MRWLIYIGFTICTYYISITLFYLFTGSYIHINSMILGIVAGSITSIFFEWLCDSNICLKENKNSNKVLVDKQAYNDTLDCTMNYWNEIELKTDKIKELDKLLEKADKILQKILKKTENKQIKQLIKNYLNEKNKLK